MNKIWRPVGLVALLPLLSAPTWGLGLGDIAMRSYLNEPLRAEIALLDVDGLTAEDIRIRLATQDDFDRLGVERAYFLTSVDFSVEVTGPDVGRILLSTEQPLLEPYLDFIVETRWPSGRLLREYTVLVDLPTSASAPVVARALPPSTPDPQPTAAMTTPPAPAAPSPTRRYDAGAAERPVSGGQYLVQPADTLWAIAERAAPAGASVEQTMLATVNLNPDAFTGRNINGLKAGYVLDMPREDDIRFSQSEATAEVGAQNRDWRDGVRNTPALRVVADDDLEVSADDADVSLSGDAAADDVDSSLESPGGAPSSEEAENLAALQSQLGSLSDQIASLRDLVVLKDQQIAELQARLAAAETAPAVDATSSLAASDVTNTESPSASAPAATAQPSVTTPPPEADQGLLGLPWWLVGVIGAALLGLLGLLVARRRSPESVAAVAIQPAAAAAATAVAKDAERAAAAPAVTSAAKAVQPDIEEGGERGYGKRLYNEYADEDPLSDAIAEADIYIAYGRYQQALDLLKPAVANDPGNVNGYLKMFDIYLKTDRLDEARALLEPLAATGNEDALASARERLAERDAQVSSDGIDLGELAQPLGAGAFGGDETVRSVATTDDDAFPELSFDLEPEEDAQVSDDVLGAGLELELEAPLAPAQAEMSMTEGGEVAPASDRLPPELAEVLGTDIPPAESPGERDEDDELVYATEADPMDTKLDLARAYLDMGDDEGARPVLEEVIEGGDLQQQAEARELLLRID